MTGTGCVCVSVGGRVGGGGTGYVFAPSTRPCGALGRRQLNPGMPLRSFGSNSTCCFLPTRFKHLTHVQLRLFSTFFFFLPSGEKNTDTIFSLGRTSRLRIPFISCSWKTHESGSQKTPTNQKCCNFNAKSINQSEIN